MKRQLYLTSLLCMVFGQYFAQQVKKAPTTQFYYAKWQHQQQTLQLGNYNQEMKKQPATVSVSIPNLDSSILENWLATANDTGGVLLYFHCLWGEEPHFHSSSMLALEKILKQVGATSPQTVIAVIWKSGGLDYEKNWHRAAEKGAGLAPFIQLISEKFAGKAQVFSHSMGNRFWEGVGEQMIDDQHVTPFVHWMLFAPDLPRNLEESKFLATSKLFQKITVVGHRRDRALWVSSKIHGCKRLGKPNFPNQEPSYLPIEWLDISDLGDEFLNHGHYLRNKKVQEILAKRF